MPFGEPLVEVPPALPPVEPLDELVELFDRLWLMLVLVLVLVSILPRGIAGFVAAPSSADGWPGTAAPAAAASFCDFEPFCEEGSPAAPAF